MTISASILGWGHTRFGKLDGVDTESLMAEAATQALATSGLDAADIDGIFVGTMNNGFSRQDFHGALLGAALPELARTPAARLENACATGSAAIHAALHFLGSGQGKAALVVGVEHMNARPTAEVGDILLGACYRKEEAGDAGFAGVFATIAQAYFDRYGDHSLELAMIAAKNHAHGLANPYAHMRRDLSVDFCNTPSDKNPYVAGPLRRTDCSPISDGAAALVIVRRDALPQGRPAVDFTAVAQTNDFLRLSQRDVTWFDGAAQAWSRALSGAGIGIHDLDFVELHDCFTVAELIQYEAMGLAPRGQGATIVREGLHRRDGKLPINPSGGLKSRGHPVGATGVSQHVMACLQLTGTAGDMQLPRASRAGVFNMGGAAVANYVSILEARA